MLNIQNQADYDKIIEDINYSINYYNRGYSRDNKYTLYLANGKKINYIINENNLPHLLGVKVENLISMGIIKKDNSYEALTKFIYESYNTYRKISSGGYIKYNDIFSKYIDYKLDVFKDQLRNPFPDEVYFVCEYDTTKTYTSKEVDEYTSDYYIARKNEKGDIILLGLKRIKQDQYTPQTSRVIKKDENQLPELTEFLKNQTITYVTTLRVENYQQGFHKDYHIKIENKKEVIQRLDSLSKSTFSIPNTINNHLFDIVGISRIKSEAFNKRVILSQLIDTMKNNEIFDLNDLDEEIKESIDDEIIEVINNYNNYLCSSPNIRDDNSKKYSDVLDEKNILSKENEELREKLKEMKEEIDRLEKEKVILEEYKSSYMDFTSKIYGLVNEEQKKNEI